MSNHCMERFGNKVDGFIGGNFGKLGKFVGVKPWRTFLIAFGITALCGVGYIRWETENRGDKLWVPQGTTAEQETDQYEQYFDSNVRFNSIIVQSSSSGNVLVKETLVDAMKMHEEIETSQAVVDGTAYVLVDVCAQSGGTCASQVGGVCQCLLTSILRQWNYDLETLENDTDVMTTLNSYGTREDLEAVLGNPTFDQDTNVLVAAEAFVLSYFLEDKSKVKDGSEVDPINEGWEKDVFLATVQSNKYPLLLLNYIAGRSFEDEFGDAIGGDVLLVNISYILVFLFLGATMGRIKCGTGSRWTMALAALMTVGLSVASGFGLASLFGLFFGPVHSLLPFILLGIGVDDAFVIVNAFNRERKVPRRDETNQDLVQRSGKALARAGSSITVTSLTDLVAFAISSSSALPALSSFCAYAAIAIFFLWLYASTFFTGCMVMDERRQRDNRRECLCWVKRTREMEDDDDVGFEENHLSRYFRNIHSRVILSKIGKATVLAVFAGLLGFGIYGAISLPVEDSQRAFVPQDSYLQDYLNAADLYFPSKGINVFFTFEGSSDIYDKRQLLSELDTRLTGLENKAPYIAEPVSEEAYRNVMTGMATYLNESGTSEIGNATLGDDGWPTSEADFVLTMKAYASPIGPGAIYAQDVAYSQDETQIDAIRVESEYVRLTKLNRGEIIDDADRQIEAMDTTRDMVASWTDLPPSFPYSAKFITIEGFKVIQRELYTNVGLAILAVGIIVFVTIPSPVTALLITANVAACIVEILGFMWALGIVIDSVSVINLVLAVGLSVDYSAHVGHCFMVKSGNGNRRATEALADIGAAVLNGAMSTFLAVVVLLFSSSYVFQVLSRQFALTVALGICHGLILLPVCLSMCGPKPFASAAEHNDDDEVYEKEVYEGEDDDEIGEKTSHLDSNESSDDVDEEAQMEEEDEEDYMEEEEEEEEICGRGGGTC